MRRIAFLLAVLLVANVAVAVLPATYSLNDDWQDGQMPAAFGQWALGYHSGDGTHRAQVGDQLGGTVRLRGSGSNTQHSVDDL